MDLLGTFDNGAGPDSASFTDHYSRPARADDPAPNEKVDGLVVQNLLRSKALPLVDFYEGL
ncbi:hypothetical protein MMC15_005198 [Xylographa vitiligo]|nr:hypothetical protein [Xylographa vitiligo]